MHERLLTLLLGLACTLGSGCGGGDEPIVPVESDVERCRTQLARIYAGLLDYARVHGTAPRASGVGFFAALVAEGIWPADAEHARLLVCPGAADVHPSGQPETWFEDLGRLDGSSSSYAGRDQEQHPLPAFPTRGDEVLIACDDHDGMNHAGALNALFADGSVVTYLLDDERERGRVPADATTLAVGPDSPIEALRKLRP